MSVLTVKEVSARIGDDLIAFAQRLVQTPSISGHEGAVAELIVNEMKKLAYDEVFTDEMGNVVGIIKGSGQGENLMFNSHMDHVDPGRLEAWKYDPYGGVIDEGYLYGRGICDMKAALASQVYAGALIKDLGLDHKGDILVTAVVLEEPAECLGIAHLCDVTLAQRGIRVDFVVLGEPGDLKFVLGHRGHVELEVTTVGRMSHSSAPWCGINAVYKMLPVISRVQALDATLPTHDILGKAAINLINISCSPGRLSIIPDLCTVSLDLRLVPGQTVEQILAEIERIVNDIGQGDHEFKASVRVREVEEKSYTGIKTMGKKAKPPWLIPADHPKVIKAWNAMRKLGHEPEFGYSTYATDGSHTAGILGIPTISYGPGEEELAHTSQERVGVTSLIESAAGNVAIAMAITE